MTKYNLTKYKLTDETMEYCGRTLHRIQAVMSFGDVSEGDIGGWVENEKNLSHFGYCWIYNNGKVYGNARIYGDGTVYGNGEVHGNGRVRGNGSVFDNGEVYDEGGVCGDGKVYGNARVYEYGEVYGSGRVHGNGKVYGHAIIRDNGKVYGYGEICGDGDIYGNTWVFDNGKVCSDKDILTVDYIGSHFDTATFFKTDDGNIRVSCGYFNGLIDEFAEIVKETHDENKFIKEYELAIELAKLHILGE